MRRYHNISGDSGVSAYDIAHESITVRFNDGGTYVYTYDSAGARAVEMMKQLATQGKGLATYINARARKAYARKLT